MWALTLIIVIAADNVWSFEKNQGLLEPWYDESRCKIGNIEKNAEGELQCCIKLPHFNKQCFIMYPKERQERKIERLKNWLSDDLCEDGELYVQGNHMFCCQEDEDALDRSCDLVPYTIVRNIELKSKDDAIFKNENLKQLAEIAKFSRPMYCYLPPVNAPFACLAFIERFFYNSVTGKCENFIYGGCRGTENNFESIEDCIAICMIAVDFKNE